MLVHSGSRTLGQSVIRNSEKLDLSKEGDVKRYIEQHDHAVEWALANRMMIAHRVCGEINRTPVKLINIIHNYLQRIPTTIDDVTTVKYIHRKGVGYVKPGELSIIPGSRGSYSYIVKMTDDIEYANKYLCSIAHGAGRRISRKDAEKKMRKKYTAEQLERTSLDSFVICDNNKLLFQETPESYKDIDAVIHDLEEENLVKVVAVLKPVFTYKS